MDIVSSLATQLKLDPDTAGGLAGALLLLVEDTVRQKHGAGSASFIQHTVPEMQGWRMSAPTLAPGTLRVGDLQPITAEAEFIQVLSRFGVEASSAATVKALVHQFLASRLDAAALAQVTGAMPLLLG